MEIPTIGAIAAIPAGAICMAVPLCREVCQLVEGTPVRAPIWRWWLSYTVGLTIFVTALMAGGLGAVLWMELPASQGIQLASTCRVLSKDVGLRTTKLCTARPASTADGRVSPAGSGGGLPQLRCYLEYYWACILEVEVWPTAALLPLHAAAEAPPRLLPAHCRPNFRAAWKTKERYKINSTYPCRYSPTNLQRVHMAFEVPRNCTAEDPTPGELWHRYWLELAYSERSIFSLSTENGQLYWGLLGGIAQGVVFAMLCHFGTMLVYNYMAKGCSKRDVDRVLFKVRLQGLVLLIWSGVTLVSVSMQYEYWHLTDFFHRLVDMACKNIGCKEIMEAAQIDL